MPVLQSVAETEPHSQIILTGGEPTLHNDFFGIMEYVQKLFHNVIICSNGVYSKKTLDRLCILAKATLQISVDGTQEVHDEIRGKGTFQKSVEAIKTLIANSIPVNVSTTVHTDNIYSLFSLAEILFDLGIKKWQVELEQAFSEISAKRQVSAEVWNKFVDELLARSKIPLKIKKIYDFSLFDKMEKRLGKNFLQSDSIHNCGCCTSKMYIYPDLTVRACTCMDSLVFGNLKEITYTEIRKNMKEKKSLLAVKEDSPCRKCKWLYLCNGGCPGYSQYYFGEIGYGDKRCPKVKMFYGL